MGSVPVKKIIYRFVIALLIVVPAIAWTQEPSGEKTLRAGRIDDTHLGMGIPFLQNTSEDLALEIHALTEALAVVRQRQADQGADLTEMRDLLKTVTGKLENILKGVSITERRLNQLHARISRLERSQNTRQGEQKPQESNNTSQPKGETLSDPEAVYDAGLRYFKEEHYDQARTEFQRIIDGHPGTTLAGQAQFWIGESFYSDGNYEQAILEYEKVVKQHPKGEKAPHALFKEGMSFSKLGDNATAKLIFQQLIEHYSDSSQAAEAAAKLAEMK